MSECSTWTSQEKHRKLRPCSLCNGVPITACSPLEKHDLIYSLCSDVGIPVGADAHIKYKSNKSFGAVLIAKNPVEVTAYNDESLFKEWIEANMAQLYNRFGHQLKKYGLWIVTITYTAPGCSINVWMDKDKDAVLSAKAKAAMVGDFGAELDWTDKITDKDWCHYTAKPATGVAEKRSTAAHSKVQAISLARAGSRQQSRSYSPVGTAKFSRPPVSAPQRDLSQQRVQSVDDKYSGSLSRKPVISPIGNYTASPTVYREPNNTMIDRGTSPLEREASSSSSITEKPDYTPSQMTTPSTAHAQRALRDPGESQGVVMFYDGIYIDPIEWWIESAKSAAVQAFGLRKNDHDTTNSSGARPHCFAPLCTDSTSQMEFTYDQGYNTGRGYSEDRYGDSDVEYYPEKDEGVHPRYWPPRDPGLWANRSAANRISPDCRRSKRGDEPLDRLEQSDRSNRRYTMPYRSTKTGSG